MADIVPRQQMAVSVFSDETEFIKAQKMCGALTQSDLVPAQYRGAGGQNPKAMANALIAYDFARMLNMPILQVMQNLDVIEGKPGFNAKFKNAALVAAGWRLSYEKEDRGQTQLSVDVWSGPSGQKTKTTKTLEIRNLACRVIGIRPSDGERCEGPWVSVETAVKEGWYSKNGSKWPNMPDLMLAYRAVSWFQSMYDPGLLLGLPSTDELQDMPEITVDTDYQDLGSLNGDPKTDSKPDDVPAPPMEDPDTYRPDPELDIMDGFIDDEDLI